MKCKKVTERLISSLERKQPRLVYPEILSFLIEKEIKTFHNKSKVMEFMSTKPALYKILKGF
jgi:hypothetical protein